MKRALLCIAMLFLLTACSSKIMYSHRLLSEEGCTVSYTPTYQGDTPHLYVEIKSDRLIFTDTPTIDIKTFDGDVFTLKGVSLATSSESSAVVVGYFFIPFSEMRAKALFSITEDQIALLDSGVAKIRISTVPITHERKFYEDVIGRRLFKQFESAKKKVDDF